MKNVILLSARRSFEFRVDDLRLTALSLPVAQAEIQRAFNFQTALIGTPPETFGVVPVTLPPGLVFQIGFWASDDSQLVPIRFINIEQSRIVIDVAGKSSHIDRIFDQLHTIADQLPVPDLEPIIGEPYRVIDYSEFTVQLPFYLTAILDPRVAQLIAGAVSMEGGQKRLALVPHLQVQAYPATDEYVGTGGAPGTALQLAVRAGTQPEDQVYFSGAPLDSEAHMAYLSQLAEALGYRPS